MLESQEVVLGVSVAHDELGLACSGDGSDSGEGNLFHHLVCCCFGLFSLFFIIKIQIKLCLYRVATRFIRNFKE